MIRGLEDKIVPDQRKAWRRELELAERVLNVAWAMATNTTVHHPDGHATAGRIMLGLYAKILNCLLSIITLTERGLPTASVMREMTEATIALNYMATDPGPLVEKYIDGVILRDLMDINRRRNSTDPEIRGRGRADMIREAEERAADVEAQRGADEVKRMRRHGWAGMPLDQVANKAGLPPILYDGAYAVDSGPAHAMDASDYLNVVDNGNVISILLASGRTLNHLLPAIAVALQAMDVIARTLQLGREKGIADLGTQMRELNRKRAAARSHETLPNSRS